MSRAYQVRVAQSLTHHVRVEDGIEARLELLGIVSPARTSELLAPELAARGFTVEGGIARKKIASKGGPVEIEVDTRTGAVKVRARTEEEVTLSAARTATAIDRPPITTRLEAEVKEELAAQARAQDQAAHDALADRLDRALASIKPDLDAATQAATRAALREKAATLGEILEVAESPSGEMTIRVRVDS